MQDESIKNDIDSLGLKHGETIDEAYALLNSLIKINAYGLADFFADHNEYKEIEEFPTMVKYASDDPAFNLAKLVEEVGEVAETITKNLTIDNMAMELTDVKHCIAMFERIVPREKLRKAKMIVIARNHIRGYYGALGETEKNK